MPEILVLSPKEFGKTPPSSWIIDPGLYRHQPKGLLADFVGFKVWTYGVGPCL
jgi:hypothetical protein